MVSTYDLDDLIISVPRPIGGLADSSPPHPPTSCTLQGTGAYRPCPVQGGPQGYAGGPASARGAARWPPCIPVDSLHRECT